MLGAFNGFCRTLPYPVFVSLTQTVQVYANVTKNDARKARSLVICCVTL